MAKVDGGVCSTLRSLMSLSFGVGLSVEDSQHPRKEMAKADWGWHSYRSTNAKLGRWVCPMGAAGESSMTTVLGAMSAPMAVAARSPWLVCSRQKILRVGRRADSCGSQARGKGDHGLGYESGWEQLGWGNDADLGVHVHAFALFSDAARFWESLWPPRIGVSIAGAL